MEGIKIAGEERKRFFVKFAKTMVVMKAVANFMMKAAMSVLALSLPVCLSAQDYIHTVDTKPIAAKVTEIGEDYVLYKTFDNPEGPNYRIPSWRVTKIVLENGTEHVFPRTAPYNPDRFGDYPRAVPPHHGEHGLEYHNGRYYYKQERLRREEIADYIGYSLYGNEYKSAKRKYVYGAGLTMIGSFALAGGIIMHITNASFDRNMTIPSTPFGDSVRQDYVNTTMIGATVCYIVGAGGLGAGIPLLVKGQRGLRKIADDYNRTYGSGSGDYSLYLGTTANGFGLSFNF